MIRRSAREEAGALLLAFDWRSRNYEIPIQHGDSAGISRQSATGNCELMTCPRFLLGGYDIKHILLIYIYIYDTQTIYFFHSRYIFPSLSLSLYLSLYLLLSTFNNNNNYNIRLVRTETGLMQRIPLSYHHHH